MENDLIGYYPSIITSLKQRVLIGFHFISPHQHRERFEDEFLCTLCMVKNSNKNLFDGQRGFSFKVRAELLSMECKVEIDSTFICLSALKRRTRAPDESLRGEYGTIQKIAHLKTSPAIPYQSI